MPITQKKSYQVPSPRICNLVQSYTLALPRPKAGRRTPSALTLATSPGVLRVPRPNPWEAQLEAPATPPGVHVEAPETPEARADDQSREGRELPDVGGFPVEDQPEEPEAPETRLGVKPASEETRARSAEAPAPL